MNTAEHTIKRNHPEGDLAVWIFILAEVITFSMFFTVYGWMAHQSPLLFRQSASSLQPGYGIFYTIVLLCGSLFAVLSAHSLRKGANRKAILYCILVSLSGILYVVVKTFEYYVKYSNNITLSTNSFFFFYYFLTVLHYMHVILGIILFFMASYRIHHNTWNASSVNGLISSAAYWHLVDALWFFLFPMFYLAGA